MQMFNAFNEIIIDAWAFLVDRDARKLSPFKYPSGAGMSVRMAKKVGRMPSN